MCCLGQVNQQIRRSCDDPEAHQTDAQEALYRPNNAFGCKPVCQLPKYGGKKVGIDPSKVRNPHIAALLDR